MKATIRLDNTPLEEFEVHNGLRQGCCIAPVLFNLVAERWTARMEGIEGVGVHLHHKTDGKLFRRYTRNVCESYLIECQFADDTCHNQRGGRESTERIHEGGTGFWTQSQHCQY